MGVSIVWAQIQKLLRLVGLHGTIGIGIGIGSKQKAKQKSRPHQLELMNTPKPIVICGRDFLATVSGHKRGKKGSMKLDRACLLLDAGPTVSMDDALTS